MADFRKVIPVRRSTVPNYTTHSEYKPLLREDFHQRCGYCGDHDYFSETYYEVDHFVPQKYLVAISKTEYTNLVYSCRSCNNSKRAKWPSGDENIPNDGKQGFIDPCDLSYPNQFERLSDGSIRSTTELGGWMWTALNLGNPTHRLKWKLEEVKIQLDLLKSVATTNVEKDTYCELAKMYINLEEQLRGKPKFV